MIKIIQLAKKIIINLCKHITLSYYKYKYGFGCCYSPIKDPITINGAANIFINRNCNIKALARLEAIQNYKGHPYSGKLIINEGVDIGQGCHIIACDKLVIEKDVTISSYVFISDCHHKYEDIETNIMKQPLDVRPVQIGEGCLIGRGVAILAGASVGKHSVIGANSVVTSTIPDYSVAVGIPAKVIKKYNFETKKWEIIK